MVTNTAKGCYFRRVGKGLYTLDSEARTKSGRISIEGFTIPIRDVIKSMGNPDLMRVEEIVERLPDNLRKGKTLSQLRKIVTRVLGSIKNFKRVENGIYSIKK